MSTSGISKMYVVIVLAVIVIAASFGSWWYWNTYLVHKMVILHPHSSEFADMVIADFRDWVYETKGYWITIAQKMMSSGDCYDQVEAWAGSPEADVWWGGGEYHFRSATRKDLLYSYSTANDADIPDELYGWPLKGPDKEWYAAALSSFGFMWNEEYLTANGLPIPSSWEDLVDPVYKGHIVVCDPSKSGSTTASLLMGLQYFSDVVGIGYPAAWGYYANLTGNIGLWVTASHEVPLKVVAGEYGIGLVIDYYYFEEKAAGEPVGFTVGSATTVSPDPGGILKGATNLEEAKLFMDYITSVRGQSKVGTIRSPVNPGASATPPVINLYEPGTPLFSFNKTINDKSYSAHRKMSSKWLVTNHNLAQEAWALIKQCEAEGKMGTHYRAAVAAYTAPPEGYASPDELAWIESAHYGPEEFPWPYNSWEDWGRDQFQLAVDEATLELGA